MCRFGIAASLTAALAAALALVPPSPAHAQRALSVGVGAVVPIGSSADRLNVGSQFVASYALRSRWKRNHIRVEYAVNSLTEKTTAKPKQQFQSLTGNLVLMGEQTAAPTGYAIIGGGWYQRSGAIGRTVSPGINAGAGIRFAAGRYGTFIEARLNYVANDTKTKYFPIAFGLIF